MRPEKCLRLGILLGFVLCCSSFFAQQTVSVAELRNDSDQDGLSDALEQELLTQFMPSFMIGEHDCSIRPAEFKPDNLTPEVQSENGTIYGQAFPAKATRDDAPIVELHYYHLWRKDCGSHGHPLDTEHVAVLIQASGTNIGTAKWKALYWYAATHENTVCDISQIARASTLDAEDHGARVWISPGKHASYLNGTLCQRGCGADHCERMIELVPAKLINLGEPGFSMNHLAFIASKAWPLQIKMSSSNFPAAPIARLNQLPATDIAWFNPGRHPVQGIIARSANTQQVLATSAGDTVAAISVAGNSTGSALSEAGDSTGAALSKSSNNTGNALQTGFRHTRHALATSARHVGEALHVMPKQGDGQPH